MERTLMQNVELLREIAEDIGSVRNDPRSVLRLCSYTLLNVAEHVESSPAMADEKESE